MECHLDPVNGDCPLVEVFCPYAYYGCEFKVGIEIDTAYDLIVIITYSVANNIILSWYG